MAKALTYEELMEYARRHYLRGGDTIFECWERSDFDDYVREVGPITKSLALYLFRCELEQQKAARYYAAI